MTCFRNKKKSLGELKKTIKRKHGAWMGKSHRTALGSWRVRSGAAMSWSSGSTIASYSLQGSPSALYNPDTRHNGLFFGHSQRRRWLPVGLVAAARSLYLSPVQQPRRTGQQHAVAPASGSRRRRLQTGRPITSSIQPVHVAAASSAILRQLKPL